MCTARPGCSGPRAAGSELTPSCHKHRPTASEEGAVAVEVPGADLFAPGIDPPDRELTDQAESMLAECIAAQARREGNPDG
jgi:hypothetical protein